MKRTVFPLTFLIVLMGVICPGNTNAEDSLRRLFFLHHSTGRLLLEEGNARQHLEDLNTAKGTTMVLWDHDYNYIGLSDFEGDLLGYDYSIPDDNTDPVGLHQLWTTQNSARDSLLARFDVIAFKSCYRPVTSAVMPCFNSTKPGIWKCVTSLTNTLTKFLLSCLNLHDTVWPPTLPTPPVPDNLPIG